MYEALVNKDKKMAVIGLGYVGLPIALEFARKISVIGFDINEERVDILNDLGYEYWIIDPGQSEEHVLDFPFHLQLLALDVPLES